MPKLAITALLKLTDIAPSPCVASPFPIFHTQGVVDVLNKARTTTLPRPKKDRPRSSVEPSDGPLHRQDSGFSEDHYHAASSAAQGLPFFGGFPMAAGAPGAAGAAAGIAAYPTGGFGAAGAVGGMFGGPGVVPLQASAQVSGSAPGRMGAGAGAPLVNALAVPASAAGREAKAALQVLAAKEDEAQTLRLIRFELEKLRLMCDQVWGARLAVCGLACSK